MKKTRIVLSRSAATPSLVQTRSLRIEKEDKRNKVAEFCEAPNDDNYPTEKLLFNIFTRLSNSMNEKQSVQPVEWGSCSNLNDYIVAGIYNIQGTRLSSNDNMPIVNSNPGHTIAARLLVLDSSINSAERCVTQLLVLSNRVGGDGNIYVRSAVSDADGNMQWKSWQKQQGITDVGSTDSLNGYIDNGIYSGVFLPNYSIFLLVVLNNYYVAGVLSGQVRSILQFRISLGIDASPEFQYRIGRGNSDIQWSDWLCLSYNDVNNERTRATAREDAIVAELRKLADRVGVSVDI